MPQTTLTCELVEAQDFEANYLAGRLDAAAAEAYEEHYFGCERCWASLRRAMEARAAFASRTPGRRGAGLARWAIPLAAAFVALVVWRGANRTPEGPATTVRGGAELLGTVQAVASRDSLRVAWPRVPQADAYRVRGFRDNGSVLWQLETGDTVLVTRAEAVVVEVAALDRLRAVIAQSSLVRVTAP
jgi:hypothetical protein